MEFTLVRHAQPLWEPQGHAVDNPSLTDRGHRQAARLAEHLKPQTFDHFYVSPTNRRRKTAAPLETAWSRKAEVLDWLEEIRTPVWEGTPEHQVRTFLEHARSRPLDEWWDGLPGGETFRDFHSRIVGNLNNLLEELGVHSAPLPHLWDQKGPGQRILIVSHLGTTSVILSHLLGLPAVPWEWERFPLSWAGYGVIETNPVADGHLWALRHHNVNYHLGEEHTTHRAAGQEA